MLCFCTRATPSLPLNQNGFVYVNASVLRLARKQTAQHTFVSRPDLAETKVFSFLFWRFSMKIHSRWLRWMVFCSVLCGVLFGWTARLVWAKCNQTLCYVWDARKKRCMFRCKAGREMCFRGKCVQIKRCRSLRCERFDPSKGRCVVQCRQGWLCHQGRCMRRCPRTLCYQEAKKRCVKRCPSQTRCLRGKCTR